MNEVDYNILITLFNNDKNTLQKCMTIDEIIRSGKLYNAKNTIFKHLEMLMKEEYIKPCGKVGNRNAYYITEKGIIIKNELMFLYGMSK